MHVLAELKLPIKHSARRKVLKRQGNGRDNKGADGPKVDYPVIVSVDEGDHEDNDSPSPSYRPTPHTSH